MKSNAQPDLSRGGTVVYDKAGNLVSYEPPTQTIEEAQAAPAPTSVAAPRPNRRSRPAKPAPPPAPVGNDDVGEATSNNNSGTEE